MPTVLTAAQLELDRRISRQVLPVIDAFTNSSPQLLTDGRVVYLSTRDRVPSLFVADTWRPAETPRRLPTSEERITFVTLLPGERTALFLSDTNSDGNFRIFRVELDGTTVATNLTPDEVLHRDPPSVARAVQGLFAYSAHATSNTMTQVLIQKADGTAPKEIYRNPQSGEVVDFAPDGKHVLFAQIHSENEQVLFEIDVDSRAAKKIFPRGDGKLPVSDARYSADGRSIIVASAAEGTAPWLERIERDTGRVVARYEERAVPRSLVPSVRVSPTGRSLAFMLDAGNHSEVRVLDARTLEIEGTLQTPLGAAIPSSFRADGKNFGLTLSVPDTPTDIYAVDTESFALTALRAESRPGFETAARIMTSIEQVRAFDGLSIPVNLYLPEHAEVRTKMPTVVLVHGGPSGHASVSFDAEVRALCGAGFAVVQPNIRGSTGFGIAYERADDRGRRGAALKDVETVNAWARAQPWCDGRLVIMGRSYGGYMTLLALTRSPGLWQAGVDNSGMSDLKTMEQLEDQSIRVYDETEFGALGHDDEILEAWSPLKDASKISSPVFIYQGANDPITPREQADRMVLALRQRGVPVEYMLIGNEGHGIVRRENRLAYLARVIRFLHERL
jgi:dipeptidyl aminopeptidase/acylaminoacyl peptidase